MILVFPAPKSLPPIDTKVIEAGAHPARLFFAEKCANNNSMLVRLVYIIDFSFHLAAAFRAIDRSTWNIGLVGNRFAAS